MFTPASTCHTIDRSLLDIDPLSEEPTDEYKDDGSNDHPNTFNYDDDDEDVGDRLDTSSSRVLPHPKPPTVTLTRDDMLSYGDLAYQVRLSLLCYITISKVNTTTLSYNDRVYRRSRMMSLLIQSLHPSQPVMPSNPGSSQAIVIETWSVQQQGISCMTQTIVLIMKKG